MAPPTNRSAAFEPAPTPPDPAQLPLALMGGAYGNVSALRACIRDARARGAGTLAFLGDAIGCCGHSDETIDLVRSEFDVVVAGNHEQQAARGAETCACGYESEEDERISCLAFEYALESLDERNRRWLGTWPDRLRLTTPAGRILLCHGSPDRTNEFLYESELDDDRLARWLDAHEVSALACTHTGIPWTRRLGDGSVAVNCGAVGKPDHDGDPAVHYALIGGRKTERSAVIRRVEYDHRGWVRQLEDEGVDKVFLDPLRTGRWTCGVESLPPKERRRVV